MIELAYLTCEDVVLSKTYSNETRNNDRSRLNWKSQELICTYAIRTTVLRSHLYVYYLHMYSCKLLYILALITNQSLAERGCAGGKQKIRQAMMR